MGVMETSPITIAPLLIRNIATTIFIIADKSLVTLAQKYKLLEHIRYLLVTSFLFFLRLLPSLNPSHDQDLNSTNKIQFCHPLRPSKSENYLPSSVFGDSGIARALTQLLSIVNDIPVSSRKYEMVRSLAEKLIDDNRKENIEALREVNRGVLSAAFSRTLSQLQAAMMEIGRDWVENGGSSNGPVKNRLNRVLKAVRAVGYGSWGRSGRGGEGVDRPAEKLAAELLWLGQKLATCGCGEEAVWRWASASNLAWLALSAEARLQGSLVKVSAFLFKQSKELGLDETEEGQREQQRQTKMKMLMCWLPLLCRASNGTDAPVLSMSERAELERILEELIEMLEREEEQEQVLSLWLHHFTYCPSSDWPNLHASYARWCTASHECLNCLKFYSAFLFKQSEELGLDETDEEGHREQQRQTKTKMLICWLPLLCRASNGTDAPVLSMSERAELERILEELIEMLESEEEQEQVLSLWLPHFTYCPSSDWPNLHASYARWCTASRKLLILN